MIIPSTMKLLFYSTSNCSVRVGFMMEASLFILNHTLYYSHTMIHSVLRFISNPLDLVNYKMNNVH